MAKKMEYNIDIVNDTELNCFDKLRQILASTRYELGKHSKESSMGMMELQKAERMGFNHTVKLINEIVKFDTVERLEGKTTYSRKTDKYSVTLHVEKFKMELLVFKGGKLYMHRTAGEGIHKSELAFTDYPEILKDFDLGALTFSDAGRSDVIELSYTFPEENYSEMVGKFVELLKKKGFTYNRLGSQSGLWTLQPHSYKKRTMVMRCMTVCITQQHINEGIELYNQFLKDEGLEKQSLQLV